ncbi:MAG: PQQ-binding-like beta-propeller repeat protein [Chlamydiota bacterium]
MSSWRQFHADGRNQGFAPVRTAIAEQPKWTIEVGPVGYGSPVVGTDNTIYIGTLKGELVAVNPNGTVKWRRSLIGNHPGVITASPAVGNDGNIYVISTVNAVVTDHRGDRVTTRRIKKSTLYCVNPAGNVLWSFPFPDNVAPSGMGGYTLSSPKVWGDQNPFIFIPAIFVTSGFAFELLVVQSGNLIFRTDIASYPPSPITADGPGLGDILSGIWDFISSPVDFDTSGVGPTLEKTFGYPEPTVAVVDYGKYADKPLILIEDSYKTLKAFRWEFPILIPLWTKTSNPSLRSTPAVFTNGLVAVGEYNGTVSFYDLESGKELWKPWYKANQPVLSPPASFGRQVYFTADKKLIVLDANSELWKQHDLGGRCLGAVALSASFAYVSANDGLYTFSFDLQNVSKNGNVIGGVSSPAIGNDGTVYVMDLRNTLWAFGDQVAARSRSPIRDHRKRS